MSRRAQFTKKPNTTFSLNINSMTDMFTIMLVFLLQTYSTNAFDIKPQEGIRMPTSVTDKAPEEAPMVGLSKDLLSLNEKPLLKVKNFAVAADSLSEGEIIKPLLSALQEIKKKHSDRDEVILQVDREAPYPHVKQILSTASLAGFLKVRLATISAN